MYRVKQLFGGHLRDYDAQVGEAMAMIAKWRLNRS